LHQPEGMAQIDHNTKLIQNPHMMNQTTALQGTSIV
jgi:hypothetical protein